MKANSAQRETQVAVVIPAYRAAAHIAGVLRGIPDFVAWIVVVEDCSPDDTAAVVARGGAARSAHPAAAARGESGRRRRGADRLRRSPSPGRRNRGEDGRRRADGPGPSAGADRSDRARRGRLRERKSLPPRPAASLDAAGCVASEISVCRS